MGFAQNTPSASGKGPRGLGVEDRLSLAWRGPRVPALEHRGSGPLASSLVSDWVGEMLTALPLTLQPLKVPPSLDQLFLTLSHAPGPTWVESALEGGGPGPGPH